MCGTVPLFHSYGAAHGGCGSMHVLPTRGLSKAHQPAQAWADAKLRSDRAERATAEPKARQNSGVIAARVRAVGAGVRASSRLAWR